jgi:hypothetical protein
MAQKTMALMICCFLVIGVGLIGSLSAEVQTLGVFKIGDCVRLVQSCANCTYNEITSIQYPNSTLLSLNVLMNKNGTFYDYTFCEVNANGNYIVNGIGNPDGIDTIWAYNFEVTPSGLVSTNGEAIVYVILIIVVLIFFIFTMIGAVRIDGEHSYDVGGKLLELKYGKYLKMGLFFLSILFLWFLFFLGWQVSSKVLMFDFMNTIFRTLFMILTYLIAPVFLAFTILAVVQWTLDLKLWKMTKRGLNQR